MSEDSISERLAREMTHEAFSPPEDLGTAQAMIDMLAQEAFPAYGFARSGQDMMSSLKEGNLGWAALAGLGLLPGIPAVTAFHGTPHRFAPTEKNPLGEFDASRVGSGEGAQAYGHGLYFAENPAVASDYARHVTTQQKGLGTLGGVRPTSKVEQMAIADLKLAGGDVNKAISNLSKPSSGYEKSYAARRKVLQDVADGKRAAELAKGFLYKVDIPDEHVAKMLDWDKPLSEQPEHVRKTFESFGMLQLPDATGAEMYRLLGADNSEEAAKRLRAAGISGIRYLDQGSRPNSGFTIDSLRDALAKANSKKDYKEVAALEKEIASLEKPTYNFVVFDPAIAKILERTHK